MNGKLNKKLTAVALSVVFIAAFAFGAVLATPVPADACYTHPDCPICSGTHIEWGCDCYDPLYGWTWAKYEVCDQGGAVVFAQCTLYPC